MAKHRYGITIPQRDKLLSDQGMKCPICGTTISFDGTAGSKRDTANIDHCHSAMVVRGILCWPCNTALGKFEDRVDILENAITYLKKSQKAGVMGIEV